MLYFDINLNYALKNIKRITLLSTNTDIDDY